MSQNENFNILALQGGSIAMSDEEVAEQCKTFPKELLHTPFINLWLTEYYFKSNQEADNYQTKEPWYALREQFDKLQKIIPAHHWIEISKKYLPNDSSDWWMDDSKIQLACMLCFEEYPPSYEGFIRDDNNGYIELEELEFLGKWNVNPIDEFWMTEESIDEYYRHHYSNNSGEELFNDLLEVFGKGNLPVWADKVKNTK